MSNYVLITSSTCDLTKEILKERNIPYVNFNMIVGQTIYKDDFFSDYPYEKFYSDIKNGMEPTTSQVGYGVYYDCFESYLKQGINVLAINLSSAISGDHQTCKSVCDELNEKYDAKVYAVDSCAASSGYGLLTLLADDNLKNGMSFEDNIKWIEENKLTIHHWFISTDLSSFIRGGRISKAAGFFGTALKICPLMTITTEGSLLPSEKIRTKAKALEAQLNKMIEFADNGLDYDGLVYISCSACEEDANKLKEMILSTFKNVKDVEIFRIGTTIGAHTGPGTVALFFKGQKRV